MANKEIAENVEAPTWDDFPQMYAQAKADTLLTRLDAGGTQEREAAAFLRQQHEYLVFISEEKEIVTARIRELEAQLGPLDRLLQATVERAQTAETQLADARHERDCERNSANLEHTERLIAQRNLRECCERATTAEARVAALTALLRRALPIVAQTDVCFESEKDDLAEEIQTALRGAGEGE